MDLELSTAGNTLLIRVAATRIDAAVAIEFKDRMRTAVATSSARVLLDLGCVAFLDSSGLGAVVASLKMMEAGRKLELAGLTPTVEKVFRLTRMDRVFTIHKDAETGLHLPDAA
mgnify:CR=1 FL=1